MRTRFHRSQPFGQLVNSATRSVGKSAAKLQQASRAEFVMAVAVAATVVVVGVVVAIALSIPLGRWLIERLSRAR